MSARDVRSMQPRQSVDFFHLTLALNLHSFGNIFFRIQCWPTLRMSFFFFFFFSFPPPLSLFSTSSLVSFFVLATSMTSALQVRRWGRGITIHVDSRRRIKLNSNSVVDRVIMNNSVQPVIWTHYTAPRHACFASTVEWRAALLSI